MTGGNAAKGKMPRALARDEERWRWVHLIMGSRSSLFVEATNAMWILEGRARLDSLRHCERRCSSAAEGVVESSSGRACSCNRERMELTMVMGRKPALA